MVGYLIGNMFDYMELNKIKKKMICNYLGRVYIN